MKDLVSNLTNLKKKTPEEILNGLLNTIRNLGVETDRDNGNVGGNFSAKLLRIASEANKLQNLASMPLEYAKWHEEGLLYYHDLDSYNLTINCLHISLKDILSKSFNTGYGTILPPKRIESAAPLTCILIQSSQNDEFGGQSIIDFDNDLAPYVDLTRKELEKEYGPLLTVMDQKDFADFIERKTESLVQQAMQGVAYNLNSMHARAGSQVPFSSVNLGLPTSKDAALVCKSFLEQYANGMGNHEQMIFPNIIFRVKSGVNRNPGDPYYNLFQLATQVSAKSLNPTYINMDADFNLEYYNKGIIPGIMGCRTYICANINGPEGPARRGNNFPVSMNLPRLGILAEKDINKFFELLDDSLEKAFESSVYRYRQVRKLKVKDLPFSIGEGLMMGSEGLSPDDSIEPVLKNGTMAIGFIGLAEALTALIGEHQGQSEKAQLLGLRIINHIRSFCDEKRQSTRLNWGCYATPAEGLSGKFLEIDKRDFGVITGVTDKDYYTNSYAVPVGYAISSVDKIKTEAPYHKLCNAGHISYIELDGEPDARFVENFIASSFEKTNVGYLGVNFHKRFCKKCGETLYGNEKSCSKCGSFEIQGISRITGYLGLDERFGTPKKAEKADRISHINGNKAY